ncbi:MAG: DNA methyltransferase [Planctomycetaceae bacterium]
MAKAASDKPHRQSGTRRHCNALDGKHWIQNSISVWSDLRKSTEESRLKHPAMFPIMLADRLIETFLSPEAMTVLDPFLGSGSTVLAAEARGKVGIGLELSDEYVELASERLQSLVQTADVPTAVPRSQIHHASAWDLPTLVAKDSVDLCITSPPYWNILNQRRTADLKRTRHYGNLPGDIGTIEDYASFLDALTQILATVFDTLKAGAYCCVVVMDLRKKNRFFSLHSDLATRLTQVGYLFDDLIIWNRQSEYNNLRPLGYPSVFRVNKVHEYVLLMQKPRA